jgi:hypothetical protein
MGKETSDDGVVQKLMSGYSAAGDNAAALRLMGKELGDDVVRKLMRGGEGIDDAEILRLMGRQGGEDVIRKLMGGGEGVDDSAVLRLMGRQAGDDDVVQQLMRGGSRPSADPLTRKLMKERSNHAALLKLLSTDVKYGPATKKLLNEIATASKDDSTFRLMLDNAASRDEARVNADALRFILGGAQDPVTRLAHLARTRPNEGKNREHAEAAEAVRDMHVLNNLLEKSEMDVEIQAWKDVGAIHMLMHDMPGPNAEQRKRANELNKLNQGQADTDALQALMATPGPPPDAKAMQRLLGQADDNKLQPPALPAGPAGYTDWVGHTRRW